MGGKFARFVVGFAAGGTGDTIARALADAIRRLGGGSAPIVDNRPGATGRIAVQTLKGLAPDGMSFLMTPGWVLTLTPNTDKQVLFDPFNDLVPVGAVSIQDYALAVGPALPVKSIAEYVTWVKAHPGSGQFASAGVGSLAALIGAMLQRSSGLPLKSIPYKGSSQSLQDLRAGHVAANIGALGDMVHMHHEGSARVLATCGTKRSKFLPDVPTFKEAGFADVNVVDWTGMFAPAGTPSKVIEHYTKLLSQCCKDKEFVSVLERLSLEPTYLSSVELAARMKSDYASMRELAGSFGMKNST